METEFAKSTSEIAGVEQQRLNERLEQLARRLNTPHQAHKVWKEFLIESERVQFRSLQEEYRDGGTVGIWSRAKKVSTELAVIQLSRKFGLPDGEYEYFLRILGHSAPFQYLTRGLSWNRELGELYYNGEVIRRIKKLGQATNIVPILDTFEEEGWPERIDDPLTEGPDTERLGQTLRTLKKGLSIIQFERDGTGTGIRVRFLP